ncbi:TetR/AcrR family transcriptional regulator [Novosphingobium sp. PP1Y]|uniref:TetR/AcrR family transcriptional regulator n=1 Tax=Novosphingobium sp. PP1Y TaxID=702113 RepID=UPI00020EFC5D|nr:TetR/AcrR family transcriptional regulator [Novosphingobium sp. PP1Y]CCA90446.1 TetR family transcriptional regulator [Novosphingobium sp. PP1Y]
MPSIRRRYTSPAMRERRKRIVDTAHRILGEGGVTSLTIRRLSVEAQVAQRTIYRLFGDKDGVVCATVVDRMKEVREHIARRKQTYTLDVVFSELDWMVSEMERDTLYARVVVGFVFASEQRQLEVRELTSVAYNRLMAWYAVMKAEHRVRDDLDIEQLAREHVMHEFLVYRRWSLGACDSPQCRLELHACFLKTAALVLLGDDREEYLRKLIEIQKLLNELASQAGST